MTNFWGDFSKVLTGAKGGGYNFTNQNGDFMGRNGDFDWACPVNARMNALLRKKRGIAMEKKKRRKLWAVLAVVVLLALGIGGKFLWDGFRSGRLSQPAGVWEDQATEQEALLLFATGTEFRVGEPGNLVLTVYCQEQIQEPVTITDDRGQTLTVLENDGSGVLRGTVEILEEAPRYGQVQATAGDAESAPVSFYVIPEVTRQMAEKLLAVCTELGDFGEQSGFADPASPEALEAVSAWLEADERVQTVRPAGEGLVFSTTDGLVGSYGLNRVSGNNFGYVDEEDAFETYQEGGGTAGLYISSEIPRTNSRILHLSPNSEDDLVVLFSPFFRASEEKLAEGTEGTLTWSEAEDATARLMAGNFTDFGLTVLNTHGGLFQREDGSDMLFMVLGERSREQIWELMDLLNYSKEDQLLTHQEDGSYYHLWGMTGDMGSLRFLVDVTVDTTGHATYHLNMTSSYLECALGDKVFDNTIFYFAVCNAGADDTMVQLLHRHGASAVIGCRQALDVGLSLGFLEQLAQVMGSPAGDYAYGSLRDALGNVLDSVDDYVKTQVCPEKKDYQDYRTALTQRPLRCSVLGSSADRVFSGHGQARGQVLDQDLNPVEGATVTIYGWLNHTFRESWTGTTDAQGYFTAPEIPYGVCGIYGEKDGEAGFTTAVMADGSAVLETKDIILAPTGAENNGGNVVGYRGNLYYWKYNGQSYDSTGAFAYYTHQLTQNQLICLREDGTREVLVQATGYGPIFIVGDRIYLKENSGNLFSVNLEGGDRADHGRFEPWTADEKSGTLIGCMGEEACVLYAKDNSIKSTHTAAHTFLGTAGGYCYFGSSINGDIPQAVLWKMSLDGSDVVKLSQVSGSSDWSTVGVAVCQIVNVGDLVYYSYGSYAGTGGFFQEGGINCVDLEGKNTQVCVPYGELGAEEFQVLEGNGETSLCYVDVEDSSGTYIGFWDDYPYTKFHVMTRKTGSENWTTTQGKGRLSKPGAFVCVEGEILRYNQELMSYQTLIPAACGFEFLDKPQGTEKEIAIVTDLDIIGDQLYFTVVWSQRTGDNFGWRPIYRRDRSVLYTMKIGETEPTVLNEY